MILYKKIGYNVSFLCGAPCLQINLESCKFRVGVLEKLGTRYIGPLELFICFQNLGCLFRRVKGLAFLYSCAMGGCIYSTGVHSLRLLKLAKLMSFAHSLQTYSPYAFKQKQ